MENLFTHKYQDDTLGLNSCFDRIVLTGSLVPIAFKTGLEKFLSVHQILLKGFLSYANKLAGIIKENAKLIAQAQDAPYIYLNNSQTKKEEYIEATIKERGDHPGLVAVLSVLEVDNSFDIFKNKDTHKLELVARKRKCLHIYFYFIDEQLGLCHFRIQTFFPFKVQIYFNGKEKLARDLDMSGISYQKDDNCFIWITDLKKAQELADNLDIPSLHALFDKWAHYYVPILKQLQEHWEISYHWSIKQIEYATDVLFKSQSKLDNLYGQLLKYVVQSVFPKNIMSFLGKKLSGPQAGRIETDSKKTYWGYRIKHKSGSISIKMYNKSTNVLRIELTFNNISEFKVYREVHQNDGRCVTKLAYMKKSIYSLEHVLRIGKSATKRYLDFLSKMDDNSKGLNELCQLTERKTENNKNYKGFNPLNREDCIIFQELLNGIFISNGFTNKDLKADLSEQFKDIYWSTGKVCRLIKRFRVFGLLKKLHNSYRYFLTEKGRLLLTLAVKLRNITVIPTIDSLIKSICPVTI